MTPDHAADSAARDATPPWLVADALQQTRADRIAERLALVALLFSVGIGIVIAMLPVSGAEAEAAAGPARRVRAMQATDAPAHDGVVAVSARS